MDALLPQLLLGLEWLAAGLGLVGVLLGLRQRRGVWQLFIASSALYGLVYAWYALYGQALLMIGFIGMSLWGLQRWSETPPPSGSSLVIRPLGLEEGLMVLALSLAGWIGLGAWFSGTSSPSPWLDALVTVVSLAAMRLMARKQLACWPAWALANGLSVWLFVSQGLWATTMLYSLQFALSFYGLWQWKREARLV